MLHYSILFCLGAPMSNQYGYGYLTKEDLIAFRGKLSEGAWQSIDVTSYLHPNRIIPDSVSDFYILFKLLVLYALENLIDVISGTSVVLLELDQAWDGLQRILHTRLLLFELDGTEEEREAAIKLRPLLLYQGGLGHTQFELKDEATFGKAQVALARSADLAPLIALLGLEELIDRIEKKSLELEGALKPGESRSSRIRSAISQCVFTLNGVHSILENMERQATPGAFQEKLAALRAPFEELQKIGQARRDKEAKKSKEQKAGENEFVFAASTD